LQFDKPEHPILSAIADSVGKERFNLWFGSDAACKVADKNVVFTVRNDFAIRAIRKHCDAYICEILIDMGLNPNDSKKMMQE
jgi:chromosomal replication initiation ATPase DnaA